MFVATFCFVLHKKELKLFIWMRLGSSNQYMLRKLNLRSSWEIFIHCIRPSLIVSTPDNNSLNKEVKHAMSVDIYDYWTRILLKKATAY